MSSTGLDSSEPVPLAVPADRASVASNAAWLSIAMMGARVCSFALAIVLGRRLGVGEYGQYGFASALGTIIVPIADIGISTYVYREVALDRASGGQRAIRLARAKWRLSLLALLVTAGLSLAIAPSANAAAIVIVIVASMLADAVSAFVYGYFQGREQMRFQAKATVAAAFARSLGGIACVFAFHSLLPVVIWMVVVSAVQLTIAMYRFEEALAPIRQRHDSAPAAIRWRSVITMGMLTLFALICVRADSVMIGVIKNHRAVGIYTAAYTILGALELIPLQIVSAINPVFARTFEHDKPHFTTSWHNGVRVVLVFSLPAALLTTILATGVLELPYGPKYSSGAHALAILVWFAPLDLVNSMVGGVLYAARREFWPMVAAGVGVAVNLGVNLWAIPRYGIAGAAAVTVATEIAVLFVQVWFVFGTGIVPFPRLPYLRLTLALLALAAVAVLLRHQPVVLSACAALAGYAVVVVGSGVVHRAELRSLLSAASARFAR